MRKIIDYLHIDRYASKTFNMYFKDRSFAVFDIETTCLSPAYCKVILSGILLVKGDECQVIQFFADQAGDEKEILQQTVDILKSVDYIITYNGRHFDIPFVEKRARKYKIDIGICPYDLDYQRTFRIKICSAESEAKERRNFYGVVQRKR